MQTAQFQRNSTDTDNSDAPSSLEYCFDTPQDWSAIRKPLRVQFRGWAASHGDGPAQLILTLPDGSNSHHSTDVERPDVVAHFARQGKEVATLCGFDFEVEIPQQRSGPYALSIEVQNDGFSSGPINFVANDFGSVHWPNQPASETAEPARSNYKDTWNAVSSNVNDAKVSVAGYTEDSEFDRTAGFTQQVLENTVGIQPQDVVLEIGCGVGRMARTLSQRCQRWIGCDVAENMLEYARQRCSDLDNVEFVSLNGWDLSPIEDSSIDVVYCTVVFMHLDEWDRFNYICEAMRVLRPGGRIYVDNYNLLSREGWDFFMKNMLDYHPLQRPSNISKSSTPEELCHFLAQAGFTDIKHHTGDDMWVYAWGSKALES
ncbi:MAG: class I SAM-dependent methyltransferase [Halieaceae bacterium]